MADSSANMSIDFLVAFTIFMVAFIWVATMIPNLFLGVSEHGIDYDAVAYRTAVILAEDPGATIPTVYTPWEQEGASGKDNVARFGLAISKDTPNILSRKKVERFFSTDFVYPDDYREKVIFGDYPYRFNITLLEDGKEVSEVRHIGDILPESNYGFIRREVRIKGDHNTTIDKTDYDLFKLYNKDIGPTNNYNINATTHNFVIKINRTQLLHGNITEPPLNPSYNAAYQIDPRTDWIYINLTDFDYRSPKALEWVDGTNVMINTIQLTKVTLSRTDDEVMAPVQMGGYDQDFLYIGDKLIDGLGPGTSLPQTIYPDKEIRLKFKPGFFGGDNTDNSGSIYITLTFYVEVDCTKCIPPRPTSGMSYLNTSESGPWNYTYNAHNVTQPKLTNAVMEVAVW